MPLNMNPQSDCAGGTIPSEIKRQNTGNLLLSAAQIITNKNEDDKEVSEIINSLKCTKCKQCAHCHDSIAAITETIRDTMIEISEIRERNRERHHRELLELFQSYLSQTNDLEITTNTNTANKVSSGNQLSEKSMDEILSPQLCVKTESSDEQKPQQVLVSTRKRRISKSMITETTTETPVETLSSLNIEKLSYESDTETVKASQKAELIAMRAKMLAMQRRKMEDRERKKRQISKMGCE